MSYQFIDANSSILTADASIISGSGTSGTLRPIVHIGSVLSLLPVANSSVMLATGINVIGSVATLQGTNPWNVGNSSVLVVGTPNIGSVIGAVMPYAQTGALTSGVTSVITGTSSVLVLASAGSSTYNYITNVVVSNGSATGTFVDLVDNGVIFYSGYAAASGGGFAASFPAPLKQLNTNTPVYTITRAQGSVIVSASGFKSS